MTEIGKDAKYLPGTKILDISGERYGRLRVVSFSHREEIASWFNCVCDCGKEVRTTSNRLRTGATRSCGCYHRDRTSEAKTKHGKRHTSIYNIWCNMRGRCENPTDAAYDRYGARGITVCDRWKDFSAFYEDMGDKPDGLTLERINNDKGYSPENCCWDTMKNQTRNRHTNRIMTLGNKTQCLAAWAEELGWRSNTLVSRVLRKWSDERALTTPPSFKDQSWRKKPKHDGLLKATSPSPKPISM